MFVLGFIITMESTLNVVYQLLNKPQSPLKYVLTYEMSQDHLELFWLQKSKRWVEQQPKFKNTLRQLLFTKNITVKSGNCSNFDYPEGDVLEFRSEKHSLFDTNKSPDNNELQKYLSHLDNIDLGYYVKEILDYIGGYIVRSIIKTIVCSNCVQLLVEYRLDHEFSKNASFTTYVNRGKLIITSKAVSLIIQQLEKSFQNVVIREKNLQRNVKLLIIEITRRSILNKSTFFFMNSHPTDVELYFCAHSHEYSLFKLICQKFINIRMRHYEKQFNIDEVFKNHSLRPKFTKLILFKNV